MENYTVELIITNNSNHQTLSSRATVDEKTAEKVLKNFSATTEQILLLGLDEIR